MKSQNGIYWRLLNTNLYVLLKSIFSKLSDNAVVVLASGNGGAQLINIATVPVLAFFFSPTAFGVLGSIVSLSSLLSSIIFLQYNKAVVIEQDAECGKDAIALCLVIGLLVFTGIMLAILILKLSGLNFGSILDSNIVITLVIALTILKSGFDLLSSIGNRERAYGLMARATVLTTLVGRLGPVFFGVIGAVSPYFLIGPLIFSRLLGGVYMGKALAPSELGIYKRLKGKSVLALAKKYKKFPIYQAPSGLMAEFVSAAPIIMSASIYSKTESGFYVFVSSILLLPFKVLGQAITMPLLRNLSEMGSDRKSMVRATSISIARITAIILVPSLFLYSFGEQTFLFFAGNNWAGASNLVPLMALLVFFRLILKPIDSLLIASNAMGLVFFIQVVLVIVTVLSFTLTYDFISAITAYVLCYIGAILLRAALSYFMLLR